MRIAGYLRAVTLGTHGSGYHVMGPLSGDAEPLLNSQDWWLTCFSSLLPRPPSTYFANSFPYEPLTKTKCPKSS